MSYRILIYTTGGRDLQMIYREKGKGFTRHALDKKRWVNVTVENILEKWFPFEEASAEELAQMPENDNLQSSAPCEGWSLPILARTLLETDCREPFYLWFVTTNRRDFENLDEGKDADFKKHFLRTKRHIQEEPSAIGAVLKAKQADLISWLKPVAPGLKGIAVLELGTHGFWSLETVGKNLNLLDFNNRNAIHPYLEQIFLKPDAPSIAAATETNMVENSVSSWFENANSILITASTGMPVLNAALRTVFDFLRTQVPHNPDLHILAQPEQRSQFQPTPYKAFEDVLTIRRTLHHLYGQWEFAAARAYLETLPTPLAQSSVIEDHRILNKWIEDFQNQHVKSGQPPSILLGGDWNPGPVDNSVFRLMQRIVYGCKKNQPLNVIIALLSIRDVVAALVLNQLLPGLVSPKGKMRFSVANEAGITPPEKRPHNINKKVVEWASKSFDCKKATWLETFFKSFEEKKIGKIRNTAIHQGYIDQESVTGLQAFLWEDTPEAVSDTPIRISLLERWISESQANECETLFPDYSRFWDDLSIDARALTSEMTYARFFK